MKITIEVDCTPDEARQFLGLPDVKPLQQAAMARLERQMTEAANALSPETLMKTWLSFVPQTPDQIRDLVMSLFRSPPGARPAAKPEASKGGASGASTAGQSPTGAPTDQITQ